MTPIIQFKNNVYLLSASRYSNELGSDMNLLFSSTEYVEKDRRGRWKINQDN